MTLIALLAMIGAKLNMGVAYWIVFSLYCLFRTTSLILKIVEKVNE